MKTDSNIDWRHYVRSSHKSHAEYYFQYVQDHKERSFDNYIDLEEEHTNIAESMDRLFHSKRWQLVCKLAEVICLPQTGYLGVRGYWENLRVYLEYAALAAHKHNNVDITIDFKFNLSLLEHWLGNKQRALDLLLEVLSLPEASNDAELIGMLWHEIGILYQELGDYESADRSYRKSQQVKKI
jgi:tetratricopeptide (TPR) repeat protein